MSKNSLKNVGFPIYALSVCNEYIFIGGGGGTSKTGITNQLLVFSKDELIAQLKLDQTDGAIGNLDVIFYELCYFIAAGTDDYCQLFKFDSELETLEKVDKFKAVECKVDPHQKGVSFSQDGKFLITCGNDFLVKVWNVSFIQNGLKGKIQEPVCVIKVHESPVLNLCIDGMLRILSVSQEKLCLDALEENDADQFATATLKLWDASKIERNTPNSYRCAVLGKGVSEGFVFAGEIDKKGWSYLEKIPLDSDRYLKMRLLAKKRITTLAISSSGKWLAYGTNDGHIGLVDAESLKRPWFQQKHDISVTCLAFSDDEQLLYSASIDQQCLVHSINNMKSKSILSVGSVWFWMILVTAVFAYLYAKFLIEYNLV